jgi:ATP-dependent Clp endopeptidase proteolytic subunit ClpP
MSFTKKSDWLYYAPANAAGDPATVQIFDQIGEDWYGGSGLSAKQFSDVLNEIGNGPLLVEINSPGGNVWDGLSIYNQLRGRKAPVTTRVVGIAASIASIIALAGDRVEMADAALMMIHDPSGMASGTSEDMRKMAEALDQHAEVLVGVYNKKTGRSAESIRAAMKAETWFTTAEALAFGLVDKPIKQLAMAAKWHPRAVTKTAPETVKNNLQKGIQQYEDGLAGDGLEPATVADAKSLISGEAPTADKVDKAYNWWARNGRFLEAEPNTPADVAANLWGGAAGRDWFNALYAQIERQEEQEDESLDDKLSANSQTANGKNGVDSTPQPTQTTDTHMSDTATTVTAAAAPAAPVDLSAILAKLTSLEASMKSNTAAPAPDPVRPVIQNLGNPLLEKHKSLRAGAERKSFLIENHGELLRQSAMIAPQNANTFAAGLVVDYLADAVITVATTKLAMIAGFTRNVGLDNLRPRATVQVKKFTTGDATVDNATNFEDGAANQSTLAATSVTVNQITKSFTVTQQELNQGFAISDLAQGSAEIFALGISKKVTAQMTAALFGAGTVIGTAANFDSSDLPAILALAKNYRQKLLLLDGGHLARLMFSGQLTAAAGTNPFPDSRYGPLNNGYFGFANILEQNDYTGAIANTAGFVCGQDAIAIASGLPVGMIAGEFVEQRTVELSNGLSVLLSVWYSRSTRAHMASYDIMFGAAAADTTQAEVLITA